MKNHNRREFLKLTGLAVAGSVLPLSACSTKEALVAGTGAVNEDYTLKVGLIGCGGRGTGAANQALNADSNVELYAAADVFSDQMESSLNNLKRIHEGKVNVPEERQFLGFDAYQKVLDSGVDVVILTAPPGFRPEHLEASVDAGVHIFCEKPVAVDAPGIRRVMDAVKKSKEAEINLVSGFCWRYHYPKRAVFDQILDGAVGEIRTIYNTYNTGAARFEERQPGWTASEFQLRNWMYYNWFSGDHIVEQAVHSIDFMSWAMGDLPPVSVMGTGGRQVRTDPKFGHIFDHFAITYEYENGAKGFHFSRQQANCENSYMAEIFGTDGVGRADVSRNIHAVEGRNAWEYEGEENDMYQTQHDELFAAIRNGDVINNGEFMATSTMMAIMGRMAAYTGKKITWDQAMESTEQLGPEIHTWNDLPAEIPEAALPGVTPFV